MVVCAKNSQRHWWPGTVLMTHRWRFRLQLHQSTSLQAFANGVKHRFVMEAIGSSAVHCWKARDTPVIACTWRWVSRLPGPHWISLANCKLQVWSWGWLLQTPSQQGTGDDKKIVLRRAPLHHSSQCAHKQRSLLEQTQGGIPSFGKDLQDWTRRLRLLEVLKPWRFWIYWSRNN